MGPNDHRYRVDGPYGHHRTHGNASSSMLVLREPGVGMSPLTEREADAQARAHVRRDVAAGAVVLALMFGLIAGHFVEPAEEAPRSAQATSTPPKGSVAARVDPGIVDINTNLAYEDAAAAGTGMVVTSAGEVITNNHVIEGATSIHATDVGNGKTYGARVIGYAHADDVAVLALEGASRLATVSLVNSSSVPVGEHVLAIGNAGGVGGTPSTAGGSVIALNQSIAAQDELDGIPEQLNGLIEIQGDVEPGDSGGPLVDSVARVIGMDTAGSTSFAFQSAAGQGFAIPAAYFSSLAGQILDGHASSSVHIGKSALLGVLIGADGAQGGESVGEPDESPRSGAGGSGAPVEQVLRGTPAASVGLAGGDTITALDRDTISSPSELATLMDLHHPGDLVELRWDDTSGHPHAATVRLGNGPPD